MMWRVENSRIMGVQMDNFRGLLGIKGMNSTPNVQIKKLEPESKLNVLTLQPWINMFSDGSAILKEWGMIRLLKRCMLGFVWELIW